MTSDEQIERLESRVDRLEDQYRNDVSAIHCKLDSLTKMIQESIVAGVKTSCPSPGACVGLALELKNQIVAHNSTMLRVERLELRLLELDKVQSRLFGGVAVIVTILTLFAPIIRKTLNLE